MIKKSEIPSWDGACSGRCFFLIVHASTREKNCLQFLILTGPESSGEERVSRSSLKVVETVQSS